MKKRSCLKTGLIAVLVVALSVACIPNALALSQGQAAKGTATTGDTPATSSTATFEKTEVVYASLAANGTPQDVYVINQFDVERAGTIVDYGDYEAVQNLTDESQLASKGNVTSFEAPTGTFYYQGNASSTVLPWKVSLTYKLDGKTVSADKLAGATGALGIHVATSRNTAVDPAFYDSFMMQITFTLDGNACTNIAAEGATMASAGQNRTVAFAVLPGHDGSFDLTAQVTDFHMDGVQIAALPYASVVEMPDTTKLESGLTDLSAAVSQLTSATSLLSQNASQISNGTTNLASGIYAFGGRLREVSDLSCTIVQISAGIEAALSGIAASPSLSDLSWLNSIGALPATLRQLAGQLDQLTLQASTVQQGYAATLTALDGVLASLNTAVANGPTADEIASLKAYVATDDDQKQTVAELVAVYNAAQAVGAVYNDDSKVALNAANTLMLTLVGSGTTVGALPAQAGALRTIADQIDASFGPETIEQIGQLANGLTELAGNYTQFHGALVAYASGISALAAGFGEVESGAGELAGGMGSFAAGTGTLSGGMSTLDASTSALPSTMRSQMDEMMADYDFPEFVPVSFVSSKNENVVAVQFVMTTAAIEQPEPEEEEEETPEQTLWDRFLALFQG